MENWSASLRGHRARWSTGGRFGGESGLAQRMEPRRTGDEDSPSPWGLQAAPVAVPGKLGVHGADDRGLVDELQLNHSVDEFQAVADHRRGRAPGAASEWAMAADDAQAALEECGPGFRVVLTFGRWAAYTADQDAASTAVGWAESLPVSGCWTRKVSVN